MPQKYGKPSKTNPPGQEAGLGYVPTQSKTQSGGGNPGNGGGIIVNGPPGNRTFSIDPSVFAMIGAGIGLVQDGEDGAVGPPGLRGIDGATGATGPQGPQGFGIDGVDGEDGIPIPGVPGPQGNPGATGAVGPQGPIGFAIDGQDGDEGMAIPGVPGPQGPTGTTGPQGPAGVGTVGFPGFDGEEGPEGMMIPGGPGPAGATGATGGAIALITETITSGSAANVTFSSIPAIYRDLIIVVRGRCSAAATVVSVQMQFNTDGGSNYDTQFVQGASSSASATGSFGQTSSTAAQLTGSTATASWAGAGEMRIYDYAGTTFMKVGNGMSNQLGSSAVDVWSIQWRSAAAINSIKLFPTSGNFVDGSIVSLYGST